MACGMEVSHDSASVRSLGYVVLMEMSVRTYVTSPSLQDALRGALGSECGSNPDAGVGVTRNLGPQKEMQYQDSSPFHR